MNLLSDSRRIFHWFMATLTVVGSTILLVSTGVNSTTAGMVFLVLVVWCASQAGIWTSLYAAVLFATSFDFFFLPPTHTFRIDGIQQWVALISFLASCVVAGRLAERARRKTQEAEQRREDVERLYTLSQEMMLYEDAAGLMAEMPSMIHRIFALDGVVLYSRDEDHFFSSTSDLPMSIQASLSSVSMGLSPTQALLGEITAMPLVMGMRPVGALGWRPAILSREIATAVTAQAAIAMTRAVAIEASARLEAAREGERLRTALIDSITHELRTPLTSISGYVETLLDHEALSPVAREFLSTILKNASRMNRLTEDLLTMARVESQESELHPAAARADQLVRDAVAAMRGMVQDEEAELEIGATTPVAVLADTDSMLQVLGNLIENGIKYGRARSAAQSRVIVSAREVSEPPDSVEFSVRDFGQGIASEHLERIFERFYRVDKARSRESGGTGLGLSIARHMVESQGGTIRAESELNAGSNFLVTLPKAHTPV